MSNNILDTSEKEIIRHEILSICKMAAPGGADTKVLKSAVKHLGYDLDEEEIKRQVSYLQMKRLVYTREVGNSRLGISRTVVSITALGIDYLEGTVPDIPGIGD